MYPFLPRHLSGEFHFVVLNVSCFFFGVAVYKCCTKPLVQREFIGDFSKQTAWNSVKHARYAGLVGNQLVVVAAKVGPQSTMMAPAGELHGVSVWMLMAEIWLTRC